MKEDWSDEQIKKMWPQALGELRAFANHLIATERTITGSQLSMALQLAEAGLRSIQMGENRADVKVERTGKVFSLASSEYKVTYPDGHVSTIWSPPWHETTKGEEEQAALAYARKLYSEGRHKCQ